MSRPACDYYPKLVSAVPFTPAPSQRLLLADSDDTTRAGLTRGSHHLAEDATVRRCMCCFPSDELPCFAKPGCSCARTANFTGTIEATQLRRFPRTFSSAKRKKARRDRRRVAEAGITFRRLQGMRLDDATWNMSIELISITFMRRGSLPYFSLDFFTQISPTLPDNMLVILAEKEDKPIAAAVFFERRCALRPLLGQRRPLRCPAFRDLLLPGYRLLHRDGQADFRARHPGRTQDQPRISPDRDLVCALAEAT